jgi:hypothetical protein
LVLSQLTSTTRAVVILESLQSFTYERKPHLTFKQH